MVRIVLATLVLGLLLNATGWAGNVFLLGEMWEQAGALAPAPLPSPFSPLVHALLGFVSDFVFAFVFSCVFFLADQGWTGNRVALAEICAVIVWLGGVPMAYLGIVNGGYLPAGIAIATTILALVTFIVVAPLAPVLIRKPKP